MVFWSGMKPVPVLLGPAAAVVLAMLPAPAHAQARAKADVACKQAAGPLQYDCVVKLNDARSNAPLTGVSLSIGADMPSMPGMHNLRPAKAVEDAEKGTYRARLVLDMHGEWALQLNLSGPVRDRVVKLLRFEGAEVTEPKPGERTRHRH
ncbi:MAG: FixH family protein [Xanthobacteraceae bacterium]|nr:FixH family protein [Xanthobacteraceae bacterium]